jgi:hypothetical protein
MYASVRLYRADPDAIDETLHRADAEFVPQIKALPGFCSYQMVSPGDGRLCTISVFRGAEECNRSNDLAADFVRERLSEFDIERLDIWEGEVPVSEAAEEMLEPAHV